MEDGIFASVFTAYAYDKTTPVSNEAMVCDDLH